MITVEALRATRTVHALNSAFVQKAIAEELLPASPDQVGAPTKNIYAYNVSDCGGNPYVVYEVEKTNGSTEFMWQFIHPRFLSEPTLEAAEAALADFINE